MRSDNIARERFLAGAASVNDSSMVILGPRVATDVAESPATSYPSILPTIPRATGAGESLPDRGLTTTRVADRYIGTIYSADIKGWRQGSAPRPGRSPGPSTGRLRMLELAILGLLKERSMHGYQLSKRLTDALGGFWRVSYGSLYPSIRRLEHEGAVERVFDEQEVGRRKNVYRITERGETLFLELLEEAGGESASEENPFRVRLAFFKYLAPETRIRVLERRRAYLEERRSAIRASLAGVREGNDTYTLALMEHGLDATESDIAWLEGLIAAERRQATTTRETTRGTKRRAARTLRRKERTT